MKRVARSNGVTGSRIDFRSRRSFIRAASSSAGTDGTSPAGLNHVFSPCTASGKADLRTGRESNYWLRLLATADVVPADKLIDITDESNQLIAILTTIVKRCRENLP